MGAVRDYQNPGQALGDGRAEREEAGKMGDLRVRGRPETAISGIANCLKGASIVGSHRAGQRH